jgi:FixJ family two-component response regulator
VNRYKDNPWALTDRQMAALDAVVATGCNKIAARSLGVTSKQLESHLARASLKMGGGHRLLRLLEWDRMRRAEKAKQ